MMIPQVLRVVLPVLGVVAFLAGDLYGDEGRRYIEAVREFAENVLRYGKDVYGEKHAPLFVDGLNIYSLKPVTIRDWDRVWITSNMSRQQNLFRTFVGLSKVTGEAKYKRAAVDAVEYMFENLTGPTGLLYWGGEVAYNALSDKIACYSCAAHGEDAVLRRCKHELKRVYPYYELMWEINPERTKMYIENFWAAHVDDWSTLAMDRLGSWHGELGSWEKDYKGGRIFFVSDGGSYANTGSDMIYAGAMLYKFTGEQGPLTWAKRLAHRFIETRQPETSRRGYQFTIHFSWAKKYPDHAELPVFGEGSIKGHGGKRLDVESGQTKQRFAQMCACEIMLGEILGDAGEEFKQWGLEDLATYGKYAYSPEDNTFVSMMTDGRKLSGEGSRRTADPEFFRVYAIAYRASGGKFHWQMSRDIAKGYGLGDIGESAGKDAKLNMETDCSVPQVLLGFLELYEKMGESAFLALAKKIGDNILSERFYKGFFVPSKKHLYTKFDALEPLVLLHLASVVSNKPELAPPRAWPGDSYHTAPWWTKRTIRK